MPNRLLSGTGFQLPYLSNWRPRALGLRLQGFYGLGLRVLKFRVLGLRAHCFRLNVQGFRIQGLRL